MDGRVDEWMPDHQFLGPVVLHEGIRSNMGPFQTFPEHSIGYPDSVKRALLELFGLYNGQFEALVERNREWATDYQFCREDGLTCNRWVQIDMAGLSPQFLLAAQSMDFSTVVEVVRRLIFEIENSLAMYQLLERIIPDGPFQGHFRRSLNELRHRHKMPIALLAVTDDKHRALRASEFGRGPDEPLTNREVYELSGFDRLFGPREFLEHLRENGGQCGYLLYVRSSDPVARLKDPRVAVEHPLLSDYALRRVIKAHSITMNIDDPGGGVQPINDTKEYMHGMGLGYRIETVEDLFSPAFNTHLSGGHNPANFQGDRLSEGFHAYLVSCGVDPGEIALGGRRVRAKPLWGCYGCYGHHRFPLTKSKLRSELRVSLRNRGPYIVQPELEMPRMCNVDGGGEYTYIDRNFVGLIDGEPTFMGGFRSMMPVTAREAQMGRNHGSQYTVWAGIS